ncbi:MAG: TetR family transcriptional regulator [Gemmatimonadaceae bacterium]|nr:TetR family transcriptional regulator [Gemmatimonadaceae bacterium]
MEESQSRQPRPGSKRDRTRAALIAATLEIVAEKGLAAATLDEIAARAGMTKGAIYSNFNGRGALLIAAMGSKGLTLSVDPSPGSTLAAHLRAVADALIAARSEAEGIAKMLAEFQRYALGDPDLRREIAAGYAEAFGRSASHFAEHHGKELTIPPKTLVVMLQSLALGLMCQYLLTPDEVTDAVIIAAVDAVAQSAVRT